MVIEKMDSFTGSGLQYLWNLKVAHRAKFFVWLLLYSRVKTYLFLYSLNVGPIPCVCSLALRAEHLLHSCPKSRLIWNSFDNLHGFTINFGNGVSSGY